MRKPEKTSIALVLTMILMFVVPGCSKRKNAEPAPSADTLTREQIINIAVEHLKSMDLYIERMEVTFDVDNEEWQKSLTSALEDEPDFMEFYQERAKGRSYQALYLAPPRGSMIAGGDWWVLVDKNNGEVLLVCSGV